MENEAFALRFKHFLGIAKYWSVDDDCDCPDSNTRIHTPELNFTQSIESGVHLICRTLLSPSEASISPDGLISSSSELNKNIRQLIYFVIDNDVGILLPNKRFMSRKLAKEHLTAPFKWLTAFLFGFCSASTFVRTIIANYFKQI
jgi:hypothetical protein